MLLSSIQIQGFKSFADKTVLKFGRGITAVVGPNGSGKSNISDAVRWVLGEQSTKSLRGQSMEDVIFGGTDTRRPHGFCEVTLNIDNADRTLNFDDDFVSITRRYYRSHESEYLINNVSVRLKDVHELFMDTGLGRDGYSMIGQGKIDNIISSRSDERRDIFEEASGISKYRYRKTEAEKKLNAAEDNLVRLKDIMNELESRVGPLEEQSRKAEKFLELAQSKKELEIGLWLYTLNNSKDALRAQESKIAAIQLKYREIEQALSEFDAETERNSSEFTRLTAEIEDQRSAISEANEETIKIAGDIGIINNDILHNNEAVDRLKAERLQLDSNDTAARDEISAKKAAAQEKYQKVSELKDSVLQLETELAGLLSDSEAISRNIEDLIKKLNILSSKSADMRVEMMTANTSIEEISVRREVIDSLIKQNESEKEKLSSDMADTEKLFERIEDDIISYSNSLKGYELRLESRQQAAEELKAKCEELRLDAESKKRRVQLLEDFEKNMEGFSHAVKKVMGEAEKGTLRGIHGPVSKLITVEKKYAVAIETALGNSIQNIVVDTENDAKRAIGFLKANNHGRATFLPISSVKSREIKESGFEDIFGFVGIASQLVQTDDTYSEIIGSLLGGTIITEDIDSAVSLSKKYNYRVKVVSLDGQVVNPGGSLTGGSLVKQAGILGRGADIKRLNDEITTLEEKLADNSSKLQTALGAASAVAADIDAVKADLTTCNEDKIRTIAEIKRLEGLMDNVSSVISELISERDSGSQKIEALKETASVAAKTIADIELEKGHIQSEIDNMTGGRDSISGKREDISEKITAVKLEIIDNEKDAATLILAANDLEIAIGSRAMRIQEIDIEINDTTSKIESLNLDIETSNAKISALKQRVSKCEDRIKNLIESRNNTEKEGVQLRASERERTMERERIGGELARLCERKDVMVKEYDDVIRQLYDEYQLTRSEAEEIGIQIEKPTEAKKNLAEIKSKIRSLGNVNVSAIEEYKEVKERYDFMKGQIDDVESSRDQLHKLINQLTGQMQELFVIGFDKINDNFSKTFQGLFGGGTARLKLSDPNNILESGIDIEARLPGKNVPSLDGLSGGEKALVALSIYFAIMQVNPPPFCFLDEVDTALDDINVDLFANFMKRSGFSTQFICVTHRRGTMEAADMLYGVTMQEKGVTKLLELNVAELEKKLLENEGA